MVALVKSLASAVVAFLAMAANAHMIMNTPMPYGKSTLNNSPMLADGSDFPCKQRAGVYDLEGASNTAAIGEPQTLSFIGGATHGGGSCQVSLTTDLQPTKSTKWMVIKSIEGGCPDSYPGNASDDPNFTGASTFQYTIPEGIAPGEYTIAWTWFNHIGNREMYMNCGPMTVSAAKKKRYAPAPKVSKRQTSFPDMFVANIGNGCTTYEDFDYTFPNPGADVQTVGNGPFTALTCDPNSGNVSPQQPTGSIPADAGSAAASATATGGSDAGVSGSAPTSAPAFASSVPTSASAAASSAANPDQVVPVTTSAGDGFSTAPPANTAAATGTAPAAAAPTGSTLGELTGPCLPEGQWNCIDGSSFQRCASGSWSAVIPMDGMKCTPGQTANFVMTPAKAKRWDA